MGGRLLTVVVMGGFWARMMFCGGWLVGCLKRGLRGTNLGDVEVAREETPVDVSAVADVGVVAVCCGELQDLLDEALVVARFLEEQLHDRGEDL
jgi:hypothetical protein